MSSNEVLIIWLFISKHNVDDIGLLISKKLSDKSELDREIIDLLQ